LENSNHGDMGGRQEDLFETMKDLVSLAIIALIAYYIYTYEYQHSEAYQGSNKIKKETFKPHANDLDPM
jgi:hypothetical protein